MPAPRLVVGDALGQELQVFAGSGGLLASHHDYVPEIHCLWADS